jgi:PAS domain S-box-containing protein
MSNLKNVLNANSKDKSGSFTGYEHKILDAASIGILISRVNDGTILYANKMAAHLLGISDINSMIGTPIPDFYWEPEDQQMVLERFRADGSVTGQDIRARRKDGSMIWMAISIQPFTFDGEQVLLSEITDITERKQAEEDLRESQLLYQSLVEVSPLSVCRKDLAGRFTFANQRFLETSHTTLTDLIGKTDFDLHPSELAEKYRRDDQAIMEAEQAQEIIEERTVHEGDLSIVQTIKAPVYDWSGKVNGIQISFWDITDRRQAEEAKRESEERFRSLYNNATIGLYRTTPDGQILMINPTGLRLLGFDSFEELAQRNLEQAGFEEVDARKKFREKIESKGILEQDSVWTKKDGSSIYVHESATVSRDENGNVLYYDGSFEDVTARKQAEEAVRESAERFRRFSEATVEGLVFHEQGKIIDVNPAAGTLFGFSDAGELVGRNLLEFVVPEAHELILKQMQLEAVAPYEIQCIHKDGTIFPVETSTRAYHDGERIIRASSIRDITERKRAEMEMHRLQGAMEQTGDGIALADLSGYVLYANPAWAKMHGYAVNEILGKHLSIFHTQEQLEKEVTPFNEKAMATGGNTSEIGHVRKDGTTFPTLMTVAVQKDENGAPVGLIGTIRDITERKQTEVQLSESEARYQLLSESTIEGIVLHDKGILVDSNKVFAAMFGYDLKEVIGMSAMEFLTPETREITAQNIRSGYEKPYEVAGLRKDGSTFPVEITGKAIPYQGRTVRVAALRDITERKQAEQALQENRQLLQLVMDNIPQSVFWKDKEKLTYLGTNRAFAEDAGFASPQDLVGKNDFDMPWKEQAELYRADDQRVLELGEPKLNYEEPQTGTAGNITWLRTSKIPMRDANGNVFAVLGMYEDITEQKRLQQQVHESFERRGYQVQVSTEISQEIASASEVSDLFDRVVTLTKERLGYYHTQLLRYDPAQDAVVLINGYGETGKKMLAGGHKMPLGAGLIGTAAESGQTIMRPTLAEDPDWQPNPLLPRTKGEIAVPIKFGEQILGVLDVQSDQSGALTEDDRLLLEGLCGQIAIAMQSAELVKTLRENESRLTEAAAIAQLGYWEFDALTDTYTFTDQFYALLRTTAEREGGYRMSSKEYARKFMHPEDSYMVNSEIQKSIKTVEDDHLQQFENRFIRADGTEGYVTGRSRVIKDAQGRTVKTVGFNQDITERKQAEEALRVNEARLAEALRAARLANWEYDVEKDLFTFNDQFYSIFHTTVEKVGGYQLSSARYAELFVYPDDLEVVGTEIGKALSSTERVYNTTIDHRIRYEDGGVGYITVQLTVERDENGKITRYYGANQDITERKQAEEALRVNEARLAEALRAARLANWEYDVEKDLFTFNDQFYSILHTTAEKMGGYQLSSARYAELFVHPDDRELVGAEIGKSLSSTERVYNTTIDHRILYADGGVGYVTIKVTVERDENGKITRNYGANQDITERKQAEEALRVNEARLAEALRAAHLANWEYDVEKDLFTFNDQFYSIFHTTAEKVGGYQLSSARYAELFVYPDDLEVVGTEIGKALSSTERVYNTTIDHRILYADGGFGYITVQLTVERDENGKITRYYGANQDITERKQAEEALRESELRYQQILDAITDMILVKGEKSSIVWANKAFREYYGMTNEQLRDMIDAPIVEPDYTLQYIKDDAQVFESGEILLIPEEPVTRYDGTIRPFETFKAPIRDLNGNVVMTVGVSRDITERKKEKEALNERLEEINRLYQNLSHEGWKTYRETENLPTGFIYDQTGVRAVDQEFLTGESSINVPMKVLGGEVVGTLTVVDDPHNPTSPEDQIFLQQVSDQIALALESARFAAQTQSALAQSEILFEASRKLAQVSDLQDLLKTAIETFNIPAINGAELNIFSYDTEGDLESLTVIANWWNGTGKEPGAIGSRYPKAMFSAVKLFLTSTPVFINDTSNSENMDASMQRIVKMFNIRAATFLPLFVGAHQIGVLVMHAEEPHNFTEEETRLFSGLAPQIATVLENRRQFERAQKQAERESTLNVISQKIQSATTVEAVLQIAARELGHALGAPMTIAQLSMKDKK